MNVTAIPPQLTDKQKVAKITGILSDIWLTDMTSAELKIYEVITGLPQSLSAHDHAKGNSNKLMYGDAYGSKEPGK